MAQRTRHDQRTRNDDTRDVEARAAEAANDEAFEELLWEIDVTRRRSDLEEDGAAAAAAPAHAPAPAPEAPATAPTGHRAEPARVVKTPHSEKRPARAARPAAPFARNDLSTRWQRIRSNLAVKSAGWVLLVGGTATLVALAISLR